MDEGKGSAKRRLMKRVIKEIAEDKGLTRFQYYKIKDWEIWDKIVDKEYNNYISRAGVKRIRHSLPKGYFNKYHK